MLHLNGMTKAKSPLVSIVMPVYNAEQYLAEAVVSILNQTYKNIELVAVNDGSKDNSQAILEEFAKNDTRLRIIRQKNTGIVGALNRGIKESKGVYIARMDADDVSFLRRIEKQVKLLDEAPNAVLVATGFEVIDEDSEFMYREIIPRANADLKRTLLLYNPIAHGSVLLRKAAVEKIGGYSADCGPTEDYELWMRLSKEGDFLGVEDLLYRWRQNRNGITFTNNAAMQEHTKKNIENYWQQTPVSIISRSDIITTGKYYLDTSRRYGPDTKNIVFSNIAQVAVKLMKHGRIKDGVLQLLLLASTGRTGLKYAVHRIHHIVRTQVVKVKIIPKKG